MTPKLTTSYAQDHNLNKTLVTVFAFTVQLMMILSKNLSEYDDKWEQKYSPILKTTRTLYDKLKMTYEMKLNTDQSNSDKNSDRTLTLITFYEMLFKINQPSESDQINTELIDIDALRCATLVLKNSATMNHVDKQINKIAEQSSIVERKRKLSKKPSEFSSQEPEAIMLAARKRKSNHMSMITDFNVDLDSPQTHSMGFANLRKFPSNNLTSNTQTITNFRAGLQRKQDKSKIHKHVSYESETASMKSYSRSDINKMNKRKSCHSNSFLSNNQAQRANMEIKKAKIKMNKKSEGRKEKSSCSTLAMISQQSFKMATMLKDTEKLNVSKVTENELKSTDLQQNVQQKISTLSRIIEEPDPVYSSDREMKSIERPNKRVVVQNTPTKSRGDSSSPQRNDEFEF